MVLWVMIYRAFVKNVLYASFPTISCALSFFKISYRPRLVYQSGQPFKKRVHCYKNRQNALCIFFFPKNATCSTLTVHCFISPQYLVYPLISPLKIFIHPLVCISSIGHKNWTIYRLMGKIPLSNFFFFHNYILSKNNYLRV